MRRKGSTLVPIVVAVLIGALGVGQLATATGAMTQSPPYTWLLVSMVALTMVATNGPRPDA